MKKHGFTLAEVLIALGIVAVIASLTAPSLTNLMPDKSKLKVIKAHKILSDVTSEMLNNPALYRDANCESWPGIQTVGTDDVCVGLGNGDMPLAEPYNTDDYKYEAKYPRLLAARLELAEDIDVNGKISTFTSIDGLYWTIELASGGIVNKKHKEEYGITIDLDGPDKGENSIAKSGVKKPDQFQFIVDTYGNVSGKDTLTKNYLKNSMKLNDKKTDYKYTGM
jgi:prepilin-type N-terminal cleavage/methylation domain-containing protein